MIVRYINNNFNEYLQFNSVYPVLSFEEKRLLIGDGDELAWVPQNHFKIIKNIKDDYEIEKNIEFLIYTHKKLANKEFLLKFYKEEDEYEEIRELVLTTEKEIFEKECEFEELVEYLKDNYGKGQIYYVVLESLLNKVDDEKFEKFEKFINIIPNTLDDFEGDLLKKLIDVLIKHSSPKVFDIICQIYTIKNIENKNIILLLEKYILDY